MVISENRTNIAYRCNDCGMTITGIVGTFMLAKGQLVKLKCSCQNENKLVLQALPDGKVQITIPCIACGGTHSFKITKDLFFSKNDFTLQCPYSGISVFFSGSDENIEKNLLESAEDLKNLFAAMGIEDPQTVFDNRAEINHPEQFIDRHMQDVVLFVLGDLADEHKIFCDCEDGGDFLVESRENKITVSCKKCHKKLDIEPDNSLSANAILEADSITLK